jgi:hypothetical protein
VGPLRGRNPELRARYLALFERIEEVHLDAAVFVRSAELRADFGVEDA